MKPVIAILLCLTCMGTALTIAAEKPPATQSPPSGQYKPRIDKEGWEILFDGKDLQAWSMPADNGGWQITPFGELHVAGKGANLFTQRRFCDYVLEFDSRLEPGTKGHSGVYLRAHNSNDITSTGIEVQIIDSAAYGAKWDSINANGTLLGLDYPTAGASNAVGQWDHFRVTVNDALVTIELNGKQVVKADLTRWTVAHRNPNNRTNKYEQPIAALPREGSIGLQNYGGAPVWFRNIRIKPLTDRQPKYTGTEKIEDVLSVVSKKEGK